MLTNKEVNKVVKELEELIVKCDDEDQRARMFILIKKYKKLQRETRQLNKILKKGE